MSNSTSVRRGLLVAGSFAFLAAAALPLAAQQQHFGFNPREKVTVLLKDFADYGNASAGAVPRDTLLVDIAPISFTYETFAPSERMYTLMNHELVHVAMMDQMGIPAESFADSKGKLGYLSDL